MEQTTTEPPAKPPHPEVTNMEQTYTDSMLAADLVEQLKALWDPPRHFNTTTDVDHEEDQDACTGSGGCDCSWCSHESRVHTARCSVKECTGPTVFRLRAWRPIEHAHRVQAHEIGRTENPDEQIPFGHGLSHMIGSERYACGKPHAHQLWHELIARYNPDSATVDLRTLAPVKQWFVEIERWRYEPDDFDLPHGDLWWLRSLASSMRYDVQQLIDTVNPHAVHRTRDAANSLDAARRTAARIVALLAKLDTRPIPQTRHTDSIPADVETVLTERAGQNPRYFHRRFPVTPASGWFCQSADVETEIHQSDAELLAAYPNGLYERPRSELILPNSEGTEQ